MPRHLWKSWPARSSTRVAQGTLLNVNLPDLPREKLKGIRLSRQGSEHFKEGMEKRLDPRHRPYYWYGIYAQDPIGEADMDSVALADDYISITPMRCDATDYEQLENPESVGYQHLNGKGVPG